MRHKMPCHDVPWSWLTVLVDYLFLWMFGFGIQGHCGKAGWSTAFGGVESEAGPRQQNPAGDAI